MSKPEVKEIFKKKGKELSKAIYEYLQKNHYERTKSKERDEYSRLVSEFDGGLFCNSNGGGVH